jgi:hypothetical protein
MTSAWTQRALTGAEAAILHHPDQRTPWAPSIVARLTPGRLTRGAAQERLAALVAQHPILDARLDLAGSRWIAGCGRQALELLADELHLLRTRFDLASGPPVRIALSPACDALAVVGHHAAVDGRALLMIARALLGAEPIEATAAAMPEARTGVNATTPEAARQTSAAREALRRMVRPADRVAASPGAVEGEAFVAAELPCGVPVRAARIAAAAVDAAAAWNAERGERWSRVGLTIPVGGPPSLGNVATHRRIDISLPAAVSEAVSAALRAQVDPPEAGLSPSKARVLRVVAPIIDRLSDSLLVSNLGIVDLPGAHAVEFYPQARGRSAVAIGACTPAGGTARLTLRARDLSELDAGLLLGLLTDRLRAPA